MTRLQFFYGIGSRYSYLASERLRELARTHEAEIEWLPINSVRLLTERGYSPFDHIEQLRGQYDPDYRERDAQRWAALYGVPFREPRGRVRWDPEQLALGASAGKLLGKAAELTRALFAAAFQDDVSLLDAAECARRAHSVGISPREFEDCLDAHATRSLLEETMQRAHAAGVFGVPTFIVDGQQFWGNDRLPLLEHYLTLER